MGSIQFKPNATQRLIMAEIEKAEKTGKMPRVVMWKGRPASTFPTSASAHIREIMRAHGWIE